MISLDGVMQGPGGPQEDTSGGFDYGGWVSPYFDEVYDAVVEKELTPADYLLGRKTYEIWAGYWPQHGDTWPGINEGMKYVFSGRLENSDPIVSGWRNSTVIKNVEEIRQLKSSEGVDLQVWGSGQLVRLLLQHDLVDDLRLKIHPLTLSRGKKLFDGGVIPAAFSLVQSVVTPRGVIIANYERAGEVATGTVGE